MIQCQNIFVKEITASSYEKILHMAEIYSTLKAINLWYGFGAHA